MYCFYHIWLLGLICNFKINISNLQFVYCLFDRKTINTGPYTKLSGFGSRTTGASFSGLKSVWCVCVLGEGGCWGSNVEVAAGVMARSLAYKVAPRGGRHEKIR